MIRSVCIYCASSAVIDPVYIKDAEKLGSLLGHDGLRVINGGGSIGLMQVVSDATLKAGGTVTGIIPRFMIESGWCHNGLTELIQTETMHERKQMMAKLSDATIALPGGYGTLEELLEIVTWRQLGLYKKPVIILNTNNYYDPLLEMFRRAAADKFVRKEHLCLWQVAESPKEVFDRIKNPKSFL
ncbi:MAG: TIGR00730 family Rossman fold protein [Tannerella sp.]|nr:TIGR00730 family Rossman fold protein [Tannerella sp.]